MKTRNYLLLLEVIWFVFSTINIVLATSEKPFQQLRNSYKKEKAKIKLLAKIKDLKVQWGTKDTHFRSSHQV